MATRISQKPEGNYVENLCSLDLLSLAIAAIVRELTAVVGYQILKKKKIEYLRRDLGHCRTYLRKFIKVHFFLERILILN